MADSITTNVTLKAECFELDEVIDSLLDAPEFDADPKKPHTAAWSHVKRDILRRRPGLEEADLDDSSELQHCTHLCVMAKLFALSETEADQVRSTKYWNRYRKEMGEVQLNDGVAQASETLLVRG